MLMFYGYREGEEPDSSDEDLQLIPQLVDRVLVPRLTGEGGRVLVPRLTGEGGRVLVPRLTGEGGRSHLL